MPTTMPRRGHKKSRTGCDDCKRRHMKCDESQPGCVNCKVASLACSYLKAPKDRDECPRSTTNTPAYSPLTPDATSVATTKQDVPFTSNSTFEAINLDHMELLHHYETFTYQSFTSNQHLANSFRDTAVSEGLRFPFLMYAILALSAMHLCRLKPQKSGHYRNLASSLQQTGLSGFKDYLLNINEENCAAVFIFSTTTGLHSFCDTFTFRDQNFNNFLERLTECIRLMRGIRSVINGGWWDYLRTTSLRDVLASGNILGSMTPDRREETASLWELVNAVDLGPATRKTYEEAINDLQRVFNAETKMDHVEGSVSMVFAWPVIISTEYNNLLVERRPEALIILAYYGVILHRRGDAWVVGAGSGEFLIKSITSYLGKHWERWLAWPNLVISMTPATTTANTPA